MTQTQQTSADTLFVKYLNTCNTAIDRHRDEFPYKQLVQLSEKMIGDKNLGVAIYKEDAKNPHDFFTIGIEDGGHLNLIAHGKENPDITWKVKQSHLEEVVENPQEFIEHPAKLDLNWLTNRLGIN